MKKHLIALVLLLCVCLCWAGAAQAEETYCTLTLDANGGSWDETTLPDGWTKSEDGKTVFKKFTHGETITEPLPTPTPAGKEYVFKNWNNSVTTLTEDTTLTAQWERQYYSVKVMCYPSEYASAAIYKDKACTQPCVLDENNCVWLKEDEGVYIKITPKEHYQRVGFGAIDAWSNQYTITNDGDGATLLYSFRHTANAQFDFFFEIATYTIILDGGDFPFSQGHYNADIWKKEEMNSCKLEGNLKYGDKLLDYFPEGEGENKAIGYNNEYYTFDGWYTAAAGGTKVDENTTVTGDATYFVRLTPTKFELKLDPNAGNFDAALSTDWQKNEDGSIYQSIGFRTRTPASQSLPTPTREGYRFDGWYSDTNIKYNSILMLDDITYYAHWTKTYKLTVEVSGIAKDNGCTVLIYDNPECTGEGVTECYGDVGETVYIKLTPVTGYTASGANKTSGSKGTLSEVDNGVATFTFDDGEATVKADFIANRYPIVFNANGGTVKNAAIYNGSDYQHGQTIGKDDYTPTRDGYTFMGWYVATVEGDTWTMTSTKFELDQDKVQGSMNLMAKWGCTITFNANYAGATDADRKLDVEDGGSVNLADEASKSYAFTRNGYNFTGWNTAANGNGTSYDTKDPNTNTITPTGNITLYAQWEIVPAKVTFDPDGGTIGDSTSSVVLSVLTSGDRAGRLSYDDVIDENTVTKSGFVFDGWYYEDFTTKCDDPFDTIFGRDTTLTAKWVEAWTITFNGNGGKDYEGNDTFTQLVRKDADEVTLNQYGGSFTCTNSKFIGWNTEKDGTGAAYSNYETITCTSDMTLYAQWYTGPVDSDPVNTESIMCVLYYSSADATPVRTGSIPYGQAYTLETVDAVKKMSIAFTEPEEKIFSGWRVGNPDEGKIYQPGAKITLNKTSDVTQVYAVWKDKTYAVNVSVSPEGSGTAVATVGGKKVTEAKKGDKVTLTASAEDGWKFSVWSGLETVGVTEMPTDETYEFTMPSGDVNVMATFVRVHTVTFYPNGGDFTGENAGKTSVAVTDILGGTSLSAVAPTVKQDHSEFDGWAINSGDNITPQKVPLDSKINSSMELEAQWTPDKHTVTFNDPEGGWTVGTALVKKGEVKDITHGDKVSAFKVPTPDVREYHTFKGWYTKNEQGEYDTKFDYAKDVITDDLQLYAKWEPVTYTLEFRTNLPVGITSVEGSVNPCSEQYNAAATGVQVPTGTFTCSFYTQNGWNTQEDGKGESFAAGAVVTYDKFPETSSGATSLMLYAQWTPKPYKVTFDANGGAFGELELNNSWTMSTEKTQLSGEIEYGSSVLNALKTASTDGKTPVPTRQHYEFAGWYTAQIDGTAVDENTTVPGETTYYAHWNKEVYELTLDPKGGSFGETAPNGWAAKTGVEGGIFQNIAYNENSPAKDSLPTPTRTGYRFDGWFTSAEGGTEYTTKAMDNNATYYAHWTQLYPIGITADPEEGGNPKLQVQGESETKETVWAPAGTVLTIVPNTKAGYRYDGWKVAEEQEVSPLSRNSSLNTGTYTVGTKGEQIVANYTKLITVTFDANGGEFAAGEGVSADKHQLVRTIDAGEKVTEPHPAPTKAGYVLDGWTIKSGDTQAQRPFSFDEPLDESVTITAKWKKLYTITVQADPAEGGTLALYKNYDKGSETLSNPYSSNTVQVPEGTVLYLAYYANEPAEDVRYKYTDIRDVDVELTSYDSYYDNDKKHDVGVYTITTKAANGSITVKYKKQFVVTFYANGGEFDSGKTTYTLWKDEDSKITSSDLPSDGMLRAGYTSAGWMTRTSTGFADFTVPGEGYTVTAPLYLYAKWSYQVTFDKGSAADAKGTMAPQTFYADTPAALNKCAFTSEDYAFAGWKVQGDTTDTVYKDKATFSSAKGDVTLVAQWTPKVTVTLDANGGHFGTSESDTTSQVKVAPGSTVSTAEPTMPRRENFDLHGWKTEDGKDFNLDSDAVNSDITLKAVWSYTVIFNRGEGDTKGPQMNNLLIVGDGEEKLPKCTYTKEGYVFAGWKVKNDTTDTVYADEVNFSSANGDVTLVAQWKKLCTIKVSVNSDSYGSAAIYLADDTGYTTPYTEVKVTEGTKLTLKVTPNTGYTFVSWAHKDGTNSFGAGAETFSQYVVQSDANIVAFLTPYGYRLTLDANGGVFRGAENATTTSTDVYHGDQVDQNYLKGLDAYLEGYDLSGWATEDGKLFDVEKTTITGDLTLVAQWTLKKCTVTFHANGGHLNDGNGTKEVQVDWGKTIQTADVPTATREGYTADEGWFTADEGGTVFDMTTVIKENTTLYAHWTLKDYTITVTTDGGGTASASKSTAHVGDVITLSATANPGKQFRGWNVKTGKVWIDEGNTFTMGAADVEIEALFDDLVTVTFDANGGTLAAGSEQQTFVKYGTATMPDDPSKEDYTFVGWYELDADHPFDFSTAVNSDLTLYAQWTKNGTPTPEPTATVTPEETTTSEPTATPTPEETTTTEPTATPTPEETATTEPTATPTPEPTATAAPTATPKPIVIVKQPTAPKGQEGQKVTITVEAEGEDLSYQWFVNRNDGKGFVPCEGSNSSTHTTTVLKPEHNGYQYYCQITSKNDSQRTDTVTLVVDKLDMPQTGDSAQLTLWLTLVAASYGGMLYILHKGKKGKAE